jgi:NHL repeat
VLHDLTHRRHHDWHEKPILHTKGERTTSNLSRFACRVLSGCFLVATAFTIHAQPLTFTTFAGPAGGPGSADGTGSAAHFNRPTGVATDSSGNVYVADTDNNTIRKITPAGVVTTLAGLACVQGSGGGTVNARFLSPTGVATDSAGNVYVGDTSNNTIRRITPAGVVTTLAGSAGHSGSQDGIGSAARFNSPKGVATDSNGNVYVADFQNRTIRKITPLGVVTTLAGSPGLAGSADGTGGAARFDSPFGVATDSEKNVYVAEELNSTIRKITTLGVVTTLAGSPGLRGSTDGTGSAARFSDPSGVTTDSADNVYVAENGNATIRKITPAGLVTTLAGSAGLRGSEDGIGSAARFYGPFGVATDREGNVFVADDNSTIRKITPSGLVTTLAGSAAQFGGADGTGSAALFDFSTYNAAAGLAIDGGGNVIVADTFNHTIRKVTPVGVVTTLAGSPGLSGKTDGTGSAARFNNPAGVATDSVGNVYVADWDNHTIRKITPLGVVTTLAGSPGLAGSADGTGSAARFKGPTGVATDIAGNVFVADYFNHTIRKITAAGVVTTLAGSAGFNGGADGTGSAARFNYPAEVATDSGGNVYVADEYNQTIRIITPEGVVTTLAGSAGFNGSADGTGSAVRFSNPEGVATDSGGSVYVTDKGTNTIRKITPAGVVTTIGGSPYFYGGEDGTGSAARFNAPTGVAADSAGNIYVADRDNNRIRIGRPALDDVATIDVSTGPAGATRQLSTSPQTATSWQWRIIRQPSGSTVALSSTSIRNPVFTPDVADLYVFQLTASDGVRTSITTVSLTATPVLPRRHAVRPPP